MQAFAQLVEALDASNATSEKVAALRTHFETVPACDAAWAIYFLAGGKPRRLVPSRLLREAACAAAGLEPWLFEECYESVGDLAETISLLLPEPTGLARTAGLNWWMRERVLPLRTLTPAECEAALRSAWAELGTRERFVFNKLITGGLRLGVSRQLSLRALALAFGLDARLLAQRIIGYTDSAHEPDANRFTALVAAEGAALPPLLPYPFFLAHGWDPKDAAHSRTADWLVEWKWDGIRAQVVRRADGLAIWSRGEELLTERFPEIAQPAGDLQVGCVLDGELLCWRAGESRPMDFAAMQTRIGRERPGAASLRQAPVVFVAFDCLEYRGEDLRGRSLAERRAVLAQLLPGGHGAAAALRLAQPLPATQWSQHARWREQAREHGAEGLMIKRLDSVYGVGRSRAEGGSWFKWKLDPYSVDAVLVYAQAGHGRRAGLYTDYTFAVWSDQAQGERRLVPFAKAYSGLADAEIRELDKIIRRTTTEKFGPVRSVLPEQVFEIGFEGIARSTRHRAGVAVRFPRILRWRRDKPPAQADTLASLQGLVAVNRA